MNRREFIMNLQPVSFLPECRYQEVMLIGQDKANIIVCTKFEDPHLGGPCSKRCTRSVPLENDGEDKP